MKKIMISVAILAAACTQQVAWQVTGYVDDAPAIYEGSASIEGTLILKSQYIDDSKPHIKVDPQFMSALPKQDSDELLLSGAADIYPEPGSRIIIQATKIRYPMEGSPIVNYSEISELKAK